MLPRAVTTLELYARACKEAAMPRFDMPLEQLRSYRPEVAEPADFDEFWERTIAEARAVATSPTITLVESPMASVEVYDVTFSGFGGDPIKAWLLLPASDATQLPAVIEYIGYGGGLGLPHERLAWVSAGYAYLRMDTRGQGSGWGTGGQTADPHGSGSAGPGFMTRGITSPEDYYYRRVFTDAVRAIDTVRELDRVDAARVAITGSSQGGGIAIAAGGLTAGLVAVMPDVPFLCHFERAVGLTERDPYQEIVRYLAVHRDAGETVFRTLSYFDGVNFARRATAPALFSVAHMDLVCPPSTVYAAKNTWARDADITDYHYNGHEGGEGLHWPRQAAFLAAQLADA